MGLSGRQAVSAVIASTCSQLFIIGKQVRSNLVTRLLRSLRSLAMTIVLCVFSAELFAADFSGRISAAVVPAEIPKIPVPQKHRESCGPSQISQALRVNPEGYVQNAVISLEGDFRGKSREGINDRNILDQKNCQFSPHITLVRGGETFSIANSDPMAHDVRIFQDIKMISQIGMDQGAKPEQKTISQAGRYLIRCGLHPWMHAYVIVTGHPFYGVSDADGFFSIKGIPEGKYTLRVWHESLGETTLALDLTQSVTDFKYQYRS